MRNTEERRQASRTAGYSGTPIAKKLGIREGHSLLLISAPDGWEVPDLPAGVQVGRLSRVTRGRPFAADVVIAFFRSAARLRADAPRIVERLASTAALWTAWPRRAGGHESDITDNLIRELLLPAGVVDVKVAALDEDWSSLKLVWRLSQRPSRP